MVNNKIIKIIGTIIIILMMWFTNGMESLSSSFSNRVINS
jgi:hypothetical protein